MTRPRNGMSAPDPWTLPGLQGGAELGESDRGYPGHYPEKRAEMLPSGALRERLDGIEEKATDLQRSKTAPDAQKRLARVALRYVALMRDGRKREAEDLRARMLEHIG